MENNKPQLRFKGFDGDWDKSEFANVFNNISNNSLSREMLNYDSGNAKNIHYGDILVKFNEIVDLDNDVIPFISDNETVEKLKNSKLLDGDIIISDAAEDEMVGKCVEIINIKDNVVLSGLHTIAIRTKQKFAPRYLGYYMNSDSYHNQLLKLMQGTKVLSISKTAIKSTFVSHPKNETEQLQLGTFFENLDKLITEHKQKHSKLKALKKAMLSKMFPKQGQSFPVIRFKGFTGNWEETSIDNLANRYDNLRIPIKADKRVKGFTPYYGANGIQDYVEGYTHDGEFILIAEDGANDLINYPIQYTNGKIWVNNHAHVLQAKNDIANNLFLKYAISQTNIEPFLVGGGRAKLNADTMMKIGVWISRDLNEQKMIANYFFNIDNLIDNQAIQIVKLNNIKKAFLAKMFI